METFLGLSSLGAMLGLLGTNLGFGISGQQAQQDANEAALEQADRQFEANLAWQREQMQLQQSWLEHMSSTAHQREVADLLAAGLNPILSATGGNGASTPSAPSPSGVSPALAHTFDPTAAWASMQQGLNSALSTVSNTFKDISSGVESLSKASQNESLTPAMKDKLVKDATAASATARHLDAQAKSITDLTQPRINYLGAMAEYLSHRGNIDWANFGLGASREVRGWVNDIYDMKTMGTRKIPAYLMRQVRRISESMKSSDSSKNSSARDVIIDNPSRGSQLEPDSGFDADRFFSIKQDLNK